MSIRNTFGELTRTIERPLDKPLQVSTFCGTTRLFIQPSALPPGQHSLTLQTTFGGVELVLPAKAGLQVCGKLDYCTAVLYEDDGARRPIGPGYETPGFAESGVQLRIDTVTRYGSLIIRRVPVAEKGMLELPTEGERAAS